MNIVSFNKDHKSKYVYIIKLISGEQLELKADCMDSQHGPFTAFFNGDPEKLEEVTLVKMINSSTIYSIEVIEK